MAKTLIKWQLLEGSDQPENKQKQISVRTRKAHSDLEGLRRTGQRICEVIHNRRSRKPEDHSTPLLIEEREVAVLRHSLPGTAKDLERHSACSSPGQGTPQPCHRFLTVLRDSMAGRGPRKRVLSSTVGGAEIVATSGGHL